MIMRKLVVAAVIGTAVIGAGAAGPGQAQDLNLGQRRAVEAYQADILPAYQARIDAAAGKPLPLTVDWAAIAKPDLADRYLEPEFWTNIYFEPLALALEQVGSDDMGRTALAGGLTSVNVTWDPATAPAGVFENGLSFEGGVLSINFEPWSNAAEIGPRTEAIVKVLENGL
jgi:hypothetical protein